MNGKAETDELSLQRRRAVASSIGQLNQEWAYLEVTVDGCISILHEYFSGSDLEKYRTKVFSKKIEYLIRGGKLIPQMNFIEPYGALIARQKELADARNWFVHGHLSEVKEDKSLTFVRHSMKSALPTLESRVYKFDEIYSLTVEIHKMGKIMRELMDTLLDVTDEVARARSA